VRPAANARILVENWYHPFPTHAAVFGQLTADASDRQDVAAAKRRVLLGVIALAKELGMDVEPMVPVTEPLPDLDKAALRRLVQRAALVNADLWQLMLNGGVEAVEALLESSFKAGFDKEVTPETAQSHVRSVT
jgi:hypothetical protein